MLPIVLNITYFYNIVEFSGILYQNAYYIFNRRVILDHISRFKLKIITQTLQN